MTLSRAEVLIDDARVRMTRFDFAPGDETGWHRHMHDYVITGLSDCPMRLEQPGGGTWDVRVSQGTVHRRAVGVKHKVINGVTRPMAFTETELK